MAEAVKREEDRSPGEGGSPPRYRLPIFEGPLDLLLFLIQKNEIDITDIPITKITDQYNEYLGRMRELDLDVAADFILMAATLIHIKSRMLLPAPKEGEEEGWEDPRKPLVDQLVEYSRFREISRLLLERQEVSSAQFTRRAADLAAEYGPDAASYEVDLFDLVEALQAVLVKAADRKERLIFAPEVNLTEAINEVLERLEAHRSMLFSELLAGATSRLHVVVTFLAILELVKQKIVRVFQSAPLKPFRVVLSA